MKRIGEKRMNRTWLAIGTLVLSGGLVTADVAAAHHAMVMYQRTRHLTLEGTVVELQWTNPHVFLMVNGHTEAGQPEAVWHLETSGPSNLVRWGAWSAHALKPGDRVSIDINPHQEETRKDARLIKVRLLDTGQELGTGYLDLDLRQ
jgi:hypothetical protein